MDASRSGKTVRYAVVGLGHIAQNAVLPAFANARSNSTLTALVSDDAVKRAELGRTYEVEHVLTYDEYDSALRAGIFDAVYIALPNSMHCDFTTRAASAGIHVLCEKPMATTSEECSAMIDAGRAGHVRLMIAYRLHFEEANLRAVEIAHSGKLGELRSFHSVFTMQVQSGNIRLKDDLGGGPLFDIGIYCINAARYIFRDEPLEALAASTTGHDGRFRQVNEAVSAILRFPHERVATFTCSFGAADVSQYQIVGTKGDLRVDPAFEYQSDLRHILTLDGRTRERTFKRRDQFAAELIYFSQCVLHGAEPEPSAREGLSDVRIIEAVREAATTGRTVQIAGLQREAMPDMRQELHKRPPAKPELVHAESPTRD